MNLRDDRRQHRVPRRQRSDARSTTRSTSSTASKPTRGYALARLLAAAERGGAEARSCSAIRTAARIPWEVEEIVRIVTARFPNTVVGMHTHDDTGCGVANALAGVRAGVRHVQGTINGYGERCGNANLCVHHPVDIELKLGIQLLARRGRLSRALRTSRTSWPRWPTCRCQRARGLRGPQRLRAQGRRARGGHAAATPPRYQHIDPELVGNECRVVVSELSGPRQRA
jgi:2-isopropylmalate synthase